MVPSYHLLFFSIPRFLWIMVTCKGPNKGRGINWFSIKRCFHSIGGIVITKEKKALWLVVSTVWPNSYCCKMMWNFWRFRKILQGMVNDGKLVWQPDCSIQMQVPKWLNRRTWWLCILFLCLLCWAWKIFLWLSCSLISSRREHENVSD